MTHNCVDDWTPTVALVESAALRVYEAQVALGTLSDGAKADLLLDNFPSLCCSDQAHKLITRVEACLDDWLEVFDG